jgi:UTP-glucose-1-phosphate uridylyltransferase
MGTRMGPVTRVLPKALFPLVGPDGAVRPVADWIAREALSAGAERICFVTSAGQDDLLRKYFAPDADVAARIGYVTNVEPFGFGYAVHAAREFAAGSAVMVMLGDHIHIAAAGFASPARQVAEAFTANPSAVAVVGMQTVDESQLRLVGVCRGEPLADNLYRCAAIVEKPDVQAARSLVTPGLPAGQYLAHAGIYVFANEIFDHLAALVAARPAGKEIGLTPAQELLLARHPADYLLRLVHGQVCDTGTPAGYLDTQRRLLDQP